MAGIGSWHAAAGTAPARALTRIVISCSLPGESAQKARIDMTDQATRWLRDPRQEHYGLPLPSSRSGSNTSHLPSLCCSSSIWRRSMHWLETRPCPTFGEHRGRVRCRRCRAGSRAADVREFCRSFEVATGPAGGGARDGAAPRGARQQGDDARRLLCQARCRPPASRCAGAERRAAPSAATPAYRFRAHGRDAARGLQ